MRTMQRLTLLGAALALAGSAHAADNCEAIRVQIEARLQASGVARYSLTTIDSATHADGKVVGSCDLGRKKIVYARGDAAPRHRHPAHRPHVRAPSPCSPNAGTVPCRWVATAGRRR